ncbi:LOW QUALITY PROTEIN: hypothetical protein Cgig2_031636 [Carnegiea gigantea]|uniref:Uncharacterized protein n=1 Tax=Carnegiea gigantea TaxID=171969 RepID=A0A9Q1K7B9_9CARY|nr:LOW QUALITY PROTEIN: hypothetical protein Cgig2_031636 [Carnegiea gigantea]
MTDDKKQALIGMQSQRVLMSSLLGHPSELYDSEKLVSDVFISKVLSIMTGIKISRLMVTARKCGLENIMNYDKLMLIAGKCRMDESITHYYIVAKTERVAHGLATCVSYHQMGAVGRAVNGGTPKTNGTLGSSDDHPDGDGTKMLHEMVGGGCSRGCGPRGADDPEVNNISGLVEDEGETDRQGEHRLRARRLRHEPRRWSDDGSIGVGAPG